MIDPDKYRHLEYSSLIMGSKELPVVTFPHRRNSQLTVKSLSKKHENNKFTKGRYNRIRTYN